MAIAEQQLEREKFAGADWIHQIYECNVRDIEKLRLKPGRQAEKQRLRVEEQAHRLNMSEFGRRIADIVGQWQRGIYHLEGPVMRADWSQKFRIELTVHGSFSTYDGSELTELVMFAHRENIRIEIRALARGYFRVAFGFVDFGKHPTLAEAEKRVERLQLN
jgi:hypothetical protein